MVTGQRTAILDRAKRRSLIADDTPKRLITPPTLTPPAARPMPVRWCDGAMVHGYVSGGRVSAAGAGTQQPALDPATGQMVSSGWRADRFALAQREANGVHASKPLTYAQLIECNRAADLGSIERRQGIPRLQPGQPGSLAHDGFRRDYQAQQRGQAPYDTRQLTPGAGRMGKRAQPADTRTQPADTADTSRHPHRHPGREAIHPEALALVPTAYQQLVVPAGVSVRPPQPSMAPEVAAVMLEAHAVLHRHRRLLHRKLEERAAAAALIADPNASLAPLIAKRAPDGPLMAFPQTELRDDPLSRFAAAGFREMAEVLADAA